MKLGMIRRYDDENAFDYLREKGLDCMELCLNYENEAQGFIEKAPVLLERSKAAGIPFASIGRWNASPLDENGKIRPHLLDEAFKTMDAAASLGCPVYVCGCNWVDGLSIYKNYSATVNFFGEILDHARPLGLKVATYNCHWNNWVIDANAWKIVLGEYPELGIKFDASHSIEADRDYLGELAEWGNRIYHVHVKGYVRINGNTLDAPPAGLDSINWPTEMAILYKYGYDGALSIEPHSGVWQGDLGQRGVDYTIRFMRNLMI